MTAKRWLICRAPLPIGVQLVLRWFRPGVDLGGVDTAKELDKLETFESPDENDDANGGARKFGRMAEEKQREFDPKFF